MQHSSSSGGLVFPGPARTQTHDSRPAQDSDHDEQEALAASTPSSQSQHTRSNAPSRQHSIDESHAPLSSLTKVQSSSSLSNSSYAYETSPATGLAPGGYGTSPNLSTSSSAGGQNLDRTDDEVDPREGLGLGSIAETSSSGPTRRGSTVAGLGSGIGMGIGLDEGPQQQHVQPPYQQPEEVPSGFDEGVLRALCDLDVGRCVGAHSSVESGARWLTLECLLCSAGCRCCLIG